MFGPGKFTITKSDDRFKTDGLTSVVGRNNRVTNRSLVGGTYLDPHGLYLDPIVVQDRATGKTARIGFLLHNDVQQDNRGGDANSLGNPKSVSFLIDGGRLIQTSVTDAEQKFSGATSVVRMLNVVASEVSETAVVTLTPEDMAALAASKTVVVRVEGATHDWTIEAKQVSKNFLPNLAAFYRETNAGSAPQ